MPIFSLTTSAVAPPPLAFRIQPAMTPASSRPYFPATKALSGCSAIFLQLHSLAVQLGFDPLDLLRSALLHLFVQPEDAEVGELEHEQLGLHVLREVDERAGLLLRLGVVSLDDEVLMPLDPAVGVRLRKR